MAVSLFTNKIENGETITLFNGGELWRDFTFVDDIVQGIELSMEYCSDNAAVFNLGNSKPVKLGYFLEQIEKRLGIKAKFKYQASNAEIKETYADVSKAHELLGYQPTTSIESGLDQFMAWYKKLDKRTRDEWAGGASRRDACAAARPSSFSPVLTRLMLYSLTAMAPRRCVPVRVTFRS